MLLEGISPALIENCARMAGMPVGPLAVADEVSLDLIGHVRLQAQADLGDRYRPNATDEVLRIMIEEQGRHGRKSGQGFYDYRESGRKRLWPGLEQCFPRRSESDPAELVRRFLWVQSLETVRCLEEGVLLDRRDADVGSVLGWSFCPALGGTIGHIETIGREKFVADANGWSASMASASLLRNCCAHWSSATLAGPRVDSRRHAARLRASVAGLSASP
jgi:3-hydroxyacyl-CoA dehydrogenase/enoyl-CoA hydratase/3-hydroxybutyryl-CoA epimerase